MSPGTQTTRHLAMDVGPILADVGNDADEVLEEPGRTVDVRRAEQSQQRMIAAARRHPARRFALCPSGGRSSYNDCRRWIGPG